MHGTYGHYENYLILGRLCNVLRLNPTPHRLASMHFGSMTTQMGEGVGEIGWVLDLALSWRYQGMQDASQMRTIQMWGLGSEVGMCCHDGFTFLAEVTSLHMRLHECIVIWICVSFVVLCKDGEWHVTRHRRNVGGGLNDTNLGVKGNICGLKRLDTLINDLLMQPHKLMRYVQHEPLTCDFTCDMFVCKGEEREGILLRYLLGCVHHCYGEIVDSMSIGPNGLPFDFIPAMVASLYFALGDRTSYGKTCESLVWAKKESLWCSWLEVGLRGHYQHYISSSCALMLLKI